MGLFELLPPQVYNGEPHVADWQQALGQQVSRLWEARDGFAAQLLLPTATWGLDYWEVALGLPVDKGKGYPERRARILGRFIGTRTTTEAVVLEAAEQISGVAAELTVFPEKYRFRLRFASSPGGLPSVWALRQLLDEIKPAHLAYLLQLQFDTGHQAEIPIGAGFAVRLGHNVFGLRARPLAGLGRLDGSWLLDGRGSPCPQGTQAFYLTGYWQLDGGWVLDGWGSPYLGGTGEEMVMRGARMPGFICRLRAGAAPAQKAEVAIDTRWQLSGVHRMDGGRKLNAGIQEVAL